ncbi:hypothetical protein [Malikia spinosa]|uniref:hypothetical protein n=1 Tax=Malikia spinosa TaxID=86180 RepID=UPI001928CB66|nr:hypothetical protein [Malikia spinosa]
MPITPAIAIHLAATLAATAIGPIALWTRLARQAGALALLPGRLLGSWLWA